MAWKIKRNNVLYVYVCTLRMLRMLYKFMFQIEKKKWNSFNKNKIKY